MGEEKVYFYPKKSTKHWEIAQFGAILLYIAPYCSILPSVLSGLTKYPIKTGKSEKWRNNQHKTELL
jgi:hypothetical protein